MSSSGLIRKHDFSKNDCEQYLARMKCKHNFSKNYLLVRFQQCEQDNNDFSKHDLKACVQGGPRSLLREQYGPHEVVSVRILLPMPS
jgi:hypothetical protein